MKKIITILTFTFCLCICNIINAQGINFNDYNIEIEKVSFEIYSEDGFMCEIDNFYEMYCNSKYSEVLNYDPINSEIKEDKWLIGNEKKVNIIDLNLETLNYVDLFKEKQTISETELATIMVYYKYTNIPTTFKSIYHANYYKSMINGLIGAFSGTEYTINRTNLNDTIKVPIWFLIYDSETNEYQEYKNLTQLNEGEEEAPILTLNFDEISEVDNIKYTFDKSNLIEINWVVNYDDTELMKKFFAELNKPKISLESNDHSSVKIQLDSTYNSDEICYIYKSNNKTTNYTKVDEIKCNEIYEDTNVTENTTYYYKALDTIANIESEILEVKTVSKNIEQTEESNKEDNKEKNNNIENIENESNKKDEADNNKNESSDDKIYGTVEQEKLGVNSIIIFLIIIIIITIFIGSKNKNYFKRKI